MLIFLINPIKQSMKQVSLDTATYWILLDAGQWKRLSKKIATIQTAVHLIVEFPRLAV